MRPDSVSPRNPLYRYRAKRRPGWRIPLHSNETGPMAPITPPMPQSGINSGALLGFVVVGVYVRSMAVLTFQTILRFAEIGLLSAALGSLLANQLSRRIKASLMGYGAGRLCPGFHQREDILDALEEGVLAIDRGGDHHLSQYRRSPDALSG